MNTVPVMISDKDLHYIKDMLSWNFIAAKKVKHYLGHVNDADVNKMFETVNELHKKHYNILLSILEQGGQYEQQ